MNSGVDHEKNHYDPFFLLFLLLTDQSDAQSNELIDNFLARPHADLATSSYIILASSGSIEASATPADALEWIRSNGLDEKLLDLDPDRNIRYGEFSYLLMQVHGIRGGIMYSLLPGPRYAARELSYKRWILGRSAPSRFLRPFEVINAVNTVDEEKEAET